MGRMREDRSGLIRTPISGVLEEITNGQREGRKKAGG